jgi:lipopolysaccharide/colanic/teichoic acid biosynthesis glycosyltransferase
MHSFRVGSDAGLYSTWQDDGLTRCRRWTKRSLDILGSAAALAVLALPMFVIAVVIRLTSPGPALFRQTRVGLETKPFVMLKFRTMRTGSSDEVHREYVRQLLSGEGQSVNGLFKLDNDPRITPVGVVLRRFSLDELPQLVNVMRGEMSLVGPRPALPWELELFPSGARTRFEVAPGLTGLWQVNGRSRLTMLQGLELDVRYAREHTLLLDLKVIVRTIPALLRRNAR